MMTSRDTLDRMCEDHDMSPNSDRLMTTGGDTSGEGVRAMIGAQFQNALKTDVMAGYKWTSV
jgi:hypothetical protein